MGKGVAKRVEFEDKPSSNQTEQAEQPQHPPEFDPRLKLDLGDRPGWRDGGNERRIIGASALDTLQITMGCGKTTVGASVQWCGTFQLCGLHSIRIPVAMPGICRRSPFARRGIRSDRLRSRRAASKSFYAEYNIKRERSTKEHAP